MGTNQLTYKCPVEYKAKEKMYVGLDPSLELLPPRVATVQMPEPEVP
jgi:hypothetical protein